MIITKRHDVFYSIEMTSKQAHDLHLFLETGRGSHCNELTVSELHGKETADSVHETIVNLLATLENR